MQESFELIAKTFQGLEEVLAQELIELGANDVQIGRRMVSFSGNQEMMYRANFCLRTAVRILKPISHFRARNADEVYKAVKEIEWKDILDLDTSFVVDTTVYSTEFRNSKFVAYKVKDAIVDYFMEREGKRPNISVANPDLRLNIHIAEENCTLSLDSSGESLHLRGYRTATVEAPINEVLAAALIKMSGWKFDCDLIDPFCGSGTILVEAALMARNIYPGVFRQKFGFENWKDFNPELLSSIFEDDSNERTFEHRIVGSDINLRAVEAALANAKAAGVADLITVEQREIRDFKKPEMPAVLITNPPYGERLRPEDLSDIYRTLGEKLKREFQGGEAWIISSREELFDSMRLRPSFKVPLQNGSLDCELRKYVTFEGKLDNFRAQGNVVKTDDELRRMGEKGRFRDGRKRDFSRKRFDDEEERDGRGAGEERGDRRFNDRTAGDRKGKFGDRERRFDDRDNRRYDDRRNEAEERYDRNIDFSDDPELAATYRNLRARHNTFERVRHAKDRKEREERGEKFERRDDRGGFNKRGGFNDRKGAYNDRKGAGDRKGYNDRGGFKGRRDNDRRDGGGYNRDRQNRYDGKPSDRRRDDRRDNDRRGGYNDRGGYNKRGSYNDRGGYDRRDKGGFSRSRRDD
ncbi:MAG: RNA methyltransferase [Prevotellaceae bacterium]|nr:RNA methyltransferase [Prevotellaceae bacterium]